jgi:hypothetical protein
MCPLLPSWSRRGNRGGGLAARQPGGGGAAAVAPATRELFAGLDFDDLAATRRVLTQVTERAGQLLT